MTTLILHAGTHKTGSSAIQTWLRDNAGKLGGLGLRFEPKIAGGTGNAPFFCDAMTDRRQEWKEPVEEVWRAARAAKISEGPHDLVASAERFGMKFFATLGDDDAEFVANGGGINRDSIKNMVQRRRVAIAQLARASEKLGFDKVRVVAFLRDDVSLNNSRAAQRAKRMLIGRHAAMFPDVKGFPHTLYEPFAKMLEKANVEVRFAVADRKADPLAKQFIKMAIGDTPDVDGLSYETPSVNSSIGELTFLCALRIMTTLSDARPQVINRARNFYYQHLLDLTEEFEDPSVSLFTPERAEKMIATQKKMHAGLAHRLSPEEMKRLEGKVPERRSPLYEKDLNPEQREKVKAMLARLAEAGKAQSAIADYTDFTDLSKPHRFEFPE